MSETMPQIESQPVDDVEVRRAEAIADAFKAATAFLDSMNKTDGASPEEREWARSQAMGILASLGNSLPAPDITPESQESSPVAVGADIAPEPIEPMFAENNIETEIDTTVAKEKAAQMDRKYEQLDSVKYVDPKDKNIYEARVIEDEDENGMVKIKYLQEAAERHLLGRWVETDVPAAVLRSMASAKQPEKVETPKQPGWIATWISERKTAKLVKREQRAEEAGVPEIATEDIKDEAASLDAVEADKEAKKVLAEAERQTGNRSNRVLYELTPAVLMSRFGNLAGKANEKARNNKKKTLGLGIIAAGLTIGAIYAGNKYGLDTDGFRHMAGDIGDIFNGDDGTSAKARTGDVGGIQLGEVIPEPKKEPLPATDTGYSFNVEPGHGYTQELVDYAQAHNANLSPEQSLDLHNHLVEKFGNYITDGGSYTQGGELRLGETGSASFKPGVVTEIDKYLSNHR